MTHQVVALLDRPSADSFALVPIVLREGDVLTVSGVAGEDSKTIDEALLDELALHYRAARCPNAILWDGANQGVCAGWLGLNWYDQACRANLDPLAADRRPGLGLPEIVQLHDWPEQGRFWIDSTRSVYRALEAWVQFATTRAFKHEPSPTPEIARLLRWTLPDSLEAQAVAYFSQPSGDAQQRRLDLYVRRARDRGETKTKEEVLADLEQVRSTAANPIMTALKRSSGRQRFAELRASPLFSAATAA